MATKFFFIVKKGYGKYARFKVEPVSEKKLEELREEGVKIYDSKSEAERKARGMK